MSRIKTLITGLVCLCLAPVLALSESPSLISADMVQAEAVDYETTIAATGVYERSYSTSPSLYYPYEYNLRVETSGAKFVEYKVGRNQEVKAGDTLAVFSLKTDEVALAAQYQALERLQAEYEQGLLSRQADIEALTDSLASESDALQRQLATLRIQRAELALEQYTYRQEKAIADKQAEIAEAEAAMSQNTLVAPCDGVVSELYYLREGDLVPTGEVLIKLSRTDKVLLRIDNRNNYFRYGMAVTVESGPVKERTYLSGRVVGADTLLPESRRSGYAYIEIDEADMTDARLVRLSASVKSYYLENVLVLPRSAVELDTGKHLVYKLVDGTALVQYVNSPMMNTSQALILQGLTEGEEVVID